jgi:ABC-type molybdate transport system substrate-binding protein
VTVISSSKLIINQTKMSDNSLRELFPSSGRIAIGGSDPRGTNTVERYQNALIRYGKQSFGIYWEVFRDLEI